MSIQIGSNIRRGSIVRAYLPHSGETDLWPRNILIHGFVFKKTADTPHAVMASRFSYNGEKILTHDVLFPIEEKASVAFLNESGLMLRTNRIDIIPLYSEYFTDTMKTKGYVRTAQFWNTVSKSLEKGLVGNDAEHSLFLELGPDDMVLTGQERTSRPCLLPRPLMIANYDDYDLALYERSKILLEERRQRHEDFLKSAASEPLFMRALEELTKAETIPPCVEKTEAKEEAVTVPNEPWWKTNPDELARRIEMAKPFPAIGQKKEETKSIKSLADLSGLTSLFNGVQINRAGSLTTQTHTGRPSTSGTKKSTAEKSVKSLTDDFQDISFEFFQLKRGNILVIPSPFDDKSADRGIVWNLYKDSNDNIVGVDIIPCRHENDGFAHGVKICDPVDFKMNGTVAVIDHLVRIKTTEDLVIASPSNGKFLNPFFQKRIEEARLRYDGSFNVHGLDEKPADWKVKNIQPFTPSPWHLKTYIRLMQEEYTRLNPQPELQPQIL